MQWQNTPTSPTTTDAYAYDPAGQRVEQQLTQSGSTTTAVYVGSVEEVATSGSATTTTKYYYAGGQWIVEAVNGTLTYLASDGLGSALVALSASGAPTASVLYAPYGGVRYGSGTMPGSYGFTGQHSDSATTGLDYYNARYYDPAVGQFTSADILLAGGLNRYAYVGGNPATFTDPSGHMEANDYFGAEVKDGAKISIGGVVGDGGTGGAGEGDPQPADAPPPLPGGTVPDIEDPAISEGNLAKFRAYAQANPDDVDTTVQAQTSGSLNDYEAQLRADQSDGNGTSPPTTPGTNTTNDGGSGGGQGGSGSGGNGGGGSGGSGVNPLANATWSDDVENKYNIFQDHHSFPKLVDDYGGEGTVDYPAQGDGRIRMRIRIYGSYHGTWEGGTGNGEKGGLGFTTWYDGYFEYIIDEDGVTITHRFFRIVRP